MEWHYFTVIDEFTGLTINSNCIADSAVSMTLSWILLIWIVVLSTAVILISGIFIVIFMCSEVI